jgi:hypothetical protein
MIAIDYVTDTSNWEKWQRDYRLGLILIMPPDPVAAQINPLRAKFDPRSHAHRPAPNPNGIESPSPRLPVADYPGYPPPQTPQP